VIRKTYLSKHALRRLTERTTITENKLVDILDLGYVYTIGIEPVFEKIHWLFYSINDDTCFVAIRDEFTGEVVTILPIEYHNNIAWKVTDRDIDVAKNAYIFKKSEIGALFRVKLRYQSEVDEIDTKPTYKTFRVCSFMSKLFDNSPDKFINKYVHGDNFKASLQKQLQDKDINVANIIYDAVLLISYGKKRLARSVMLRDLY